MFRWDDCLEGHVLLGIIFNLTAFILLTLTAFSTPYIKSIYYLQAPTGLKYGSFGYCDRTRCSGKQVGYDTGPEIVEWLTRTQILFAIAAFAMLFSLIALMLSLLRAGKSRTWSNPIYFRSLALIGSGCAIAAEIFALVLWVTARHRYNDSRNPGRATYGAALWLGLTGAITAFVSACVGGPAYAGQGGMYWANRGVAYNV